MPEDSRKRSEVVHRPKARSVDLKRSDERAHVHGGGRGVSRSEPLKAPDALLTLSKEEKPNRRQPPRKKMTTTVGGTDIASNADNQEGRRY